MPRGGAAAMMPSMPRRVVFIVNPQSRGGATGRAWPALGTKLREMVGDFGTYFTRKPMEATELTRYALERGADVVVAVGGDGTTNEVVNGFFDEKGGLVRPGAALAVLPRGTGSDFLRSFTIDSGVEATAARLAWGKPRPFDVGRVHFHDLEGRPLTRHFANVASFGISGVIDGYVNQMRKSLGGKLSFILGSIKGLATYRDSLCRFRLDDGPWEEVSLTCLAIANGQYFGGGMKVAPEARTDDGIFDVTLWQGYGLGDFVLKGKKLYDGSHVALSGTRTYKARRVEATCEEDCLLDVDGEAPGRLPATFEILPSAINLIV